MNKDPFEDSRFLKLEPYLFLALCLVSLSPILLLPNFPSVDGPAHLAIAHIWHDLSVNDQSGFRDIFRVSIQNYPNWFCYLALRVLMWVFDPLLAEKILVGGYVFLLPYVIRYAVTSISPKAWPASYFGVFFAFNFTLFFGFYNFNWGFLFAVLMLGYYVRYRHHWTLPHMLIFSVLALLSYYVHATSLIMSSMMVGVLETGFFAAGLFSAKDNHRLGQLKRYLGRAVALLASYGPALALLFAFFLLPSGEAVVQKSQAIGVPFSQDFFAVQKYVQLITGAIFNYSPDLSPVFGTAIFFLLLYVNIYCFSRVGNDAALQLPFLLFLLVIVGIFIIIPFQINVRWAPARFSLYLLFCLVLFFASQVVRLPALYKPKFLTAMLIAILALNIAGSYGRYQQLKVITDLQQELFSALTSLEKGRPLLLLRIKEPEDSFRMRFNFNGLAIQAGGYGTILADAPDVKLFQAKTNSVPVQFRAEASSYDHWLEDGDLVRPVPAVDFASLDMTAPYAPHYVILVGGSNHRQDPEYKELLETVGRYYHRDQAAGTGRVLVFRRNNG